MNERQSIADCRYFFAVNLLLSAHIFLHYGFPCDSMLQNFIFFTFFAFSHHNVSYLIYLQINTL